VAARLPCVYCDSTCLSLAVLVLVVGDQAMWLHVAWCAQFCLNVSAC
jgi:hypothetical protein